MRIPFYKFQGTGNDFVIVDNRKGTFNSLTIQQIQRICDRKFGVGADGFIRLNTREHLDFEVEYFNADGTKSFCGNGTRCAVQMAAQLGIQLENYRFLAIDGEHEAQMIADEVSLCMAQVHGISLEGADCVLNTGSPHFIRFCSDVHEIDVFSEGKKVRNSPKFASEGINVNFVEITGENSLFVRTFERGVEDETLSCGTGVTAAALAFSFKQNLVGPQRVEIRTLGGNLAVAFNRVSADEFKDVKLIGPATFVFKGEINV